MCIMPIACPNLYTIVFSLDFFLFFPHISYKWPTISLVIWFAMQEIKFNIYLKNFLIILYKKRNNQYLVLMCT